MKKILMAVAVLLTAACSKDGASQFKVYDSNAITFKVGVTKATAVTTANLEEFYVSAYAAGYKLNNGVYLDGRKFVKAGDYATTGNYEANPACYWLGEHALNFMAYSPVADLNGGSYVFVGNGDMATYAEAASARGIKNLTIYPTIKDQKDIVIALPNDNGALKTYTVNDQGNITLTFDHVLSQVEIQAKNENDLFDYEVAGVRIGMVPSQGTLPLTGADKNVWTVSAKNTFSYEFASGEAAVALDGTPKSIMGQGGAAMLIPSASIAAWDPSEKTNSSKGAFLAAKVKVTTKIGGNKVFPENSDNYGWVAVPLKDDNGALQTWTAGEKYTYTLDFTEGAGYVAPDVADPGYGTNKKAGDAVLGDITFTVSVSPWGDKGNTDIPTEAEGK